MALDTSVLLSRLATLTADLKPVSGTSNKTLQQARVTIASALTSADSSVFSPPASAASPASAPTAQRALDVLQAAISESSPDLVNGDAFTIVRRTVPLAVSGISGFTPAVAGFSADLSFGPFLDPIGRPVWIVLYRIVRQVKLVRVAGGTPFLSVPVRDFLGTESTLTLGPGSVWIASPLLATGAPASSYTGLLVGSGMVRFSSPLPHSGLEIVVPAAVTCTLQLDLNPGAPAAGTGAGQDARLSSATLPAKATFVFSPAGATVSSVAKASATVYGSSVEIDVSSGSAIFDAATSHIIYKATTPATIFAINYVRSDQVQPAGSAKIDGVAWALPVAVTSPSSLATASGSGSLALVLNTGLTVAWKGQATPLAAPKLVLLLSPGLITILALDILGFGATQTIPLWSASSGGPTTSQATLTWSSPFALRYFSSSSGVEILALSASFDGNFDRPITVIGRRVYVHSDLVLCLFIESPTFNGLIVEGALQPPPVNPTAPLAFAIENAVFRTTPANAIILVALYNGTESTAVGLALGFGLLNLLPTLPDPYAANFSIAVRQFIDTQPVGSLSAIVLWTAAVAPALTYFLPSNAASALVGASTGVGSDVFAAFATTGERLGAVVLLDLSTNVDQFGVAWATNPTMAAPLSVDSMFLASEGEAVYVLTVPAVQWEPVYTEPAPAPPYPVGFPSPMSFSNNGGPTVIGVLTADLVRVAPAPALDNLVANFTTSPTPASANAQFTLPFGIRALATLNKPSGPGSPGATVAYNRPSFTSESITGGYQVSLRAVDPNYPAYPSFQGSTVQLENGLFNGVSTGMSVLGPDVDAIFNPYLGPGGTRPLVPVTRLDLSGYGESLFSDWRNLTNDITAVSKARFDVLIGRTAVEVVQVRSILYPYGVRVVRTITIDRKNTGVVTRHDSGWQAASDGVYAFPPGTLTVHPGVVLQMVNVTNIRDSGQFADAGGVQVAGVYFDGDLVVDGVTKGAGVDGVPARNQIGYVQLTPESSGGPLTPDQYQQLIQNVGPMGGAVDCVINVAASGLPMKIGRVGVGVTQGMGGPEFVMTAWGSPQFPVGGQWSFLQQTGSGTAPEVVNTDLGVPLIRAGAAPTPPPPTSPYRFADPVDLANPSNPQSDYGIVHATGTQRVFFPRPKIEANAPTQITSTVAPTLADPYSLANAVGFFPRTDSAIPFPNANYSLAISSVGAIKLQLPTPSFPVAVGQRTIAQAGGVRAYADYTGSTATIAIDTAAAVPWSFTLQAVSFATSSSLLGEVMRVTADVNASANSATQLANPQMTFGGALAPVQGVLAFLTVLGLPLPFSVAMTNQLKIKAGLKIPKLDDELNKLLLPPPPTPPPPCILQFSEGDIVVSETIASPLSEASFELSATLLVPTDFCPLYAAGMFEIKIAISTVTGNTFTLTVGAGLGVVINIGIGKVKAYLLETMFFIVGDTVIGFGVGLLIKGSIDLEVISVDVSVEAKMAVLAVPSSSSCASLTVYGAAQLTFALDITICWVIDIDFEEQFEYDQKLNSGPCALPPDIL
jgi:hypothetical protein